MLITPTIDKLHALALAGMARALVDQLERPDYAALSFEERLGLLVDREMQDRETACLHATSRPPVSAATRSSRISTCAAPGGSTGRPSWASPRATGSPRTATCS